MSSSLSLEFVWHGKPSTVQAVCIFVVHIISGHTEILWRPVMSLAQPWHQPTTIVLRSSELGKLSPSSVSRKSLVFCSFLTWDRLRGADTESFLVFAWRLKLVTRNGV